MPTLRLRGGIEVPVDAFEPGDAWLEWQRRRAAVTQTGKWPLILAGELPEAPLIADDGQTADQIVAQLLFTYGPDVVVQGTGTVSGLAQALVGGHSWFFWWD